MVMVVMIFSIMRMFGMMVAVLRGFFVPFLYVFAVILLFGQACSSSTAVKAPTSPTQIVPSYRILSTICCVFSL